MGSGDVSSLLNHPPSDADSTQARGNRKAADMKPFFVGAPQVICSAWAINFIGQYVICPARIIEKFFCEPIRIDRKRGLAASPIHGLLASSEPVGDCLRIQPRCLT